MFAVRYTIKPPTRHSHNGAGDGTRTHTPLQTAELKSDASTNYATPAYFRARRRLFSYAIEILFCIFGNQGIYENGGVKTIIDYRIMGFLFAYLLLVAEQTGLEPAHRSHGYSSLSRRLSYQLGLLLHRYYILTIYFE